MQCEKCKIDKPDVAPRVFGGMSKLLCNDCQKINAGQQGVGMLIVLAVVLVLMWLMFR